MSETAAARTTGWRVCLAALGVLVVAGLCGLIAATGSANGSMTGSTEMAAASAAADPGTPAMTCDGACAMGSPQTCSVVALTGVSLLVLLLASRRRTYLGRGPRRSPSGPVRSGAGPPRPWLTLSPLDLCVIRV
ncbi:MAG: hypothetical protein LH468_06985 [Nocardioides sp.]|nr:hypothetical protein [Nocardioides sp.]